MTDESPVPEPVMPAAASESARYNTKLVVGLILAIIAIILLPFANLFTVLLGIAAIILGHLGLVEIRSTRERSRELGIATLVLGYLGPALVLLILLVAGAAVGHNVPGNGGQDDKCSWASPPTKQQEQACFNSIGGDNQN